MKKFWITLALCTGYLSTYAFQEMDKVKITSSKVTEEVYLLKGAGGNIGVLTGPDGLFMIDDQYAPLSSKIMDALKNISSEPLRFLINTHHHGDHTGGNKNFEAQGALIMAHENVRTRLIENSKDSTAGLPLITFNDQLNLHANGNDVMIVHVHNAHTNGDALIYLPQSNVLHTGDTFFNGMFPFIDLSSGGSVLGAIEAVEKGLSIINKNTKVIPGHGELATYEDYVNYLSMLKQIKDKMQLKINEGMTEEEIIEDETITSGFYSDEQAKDFFIDGPKIRATFYNSLKK